MSTGTLVILSLLDVSNSPGVQAAEDSDILQERLGHLIAETNRVGEFFFREIFHSTSDGPIKY